MSKQKLLNIIIIIFMFIIMGVGVYKYYTLQKSINALQAQINEMNNNVELTAKTTNPNKLELDINYAVYLDSANTLNQKLIDLENELAQIEYKKTVSNSASEESDYINKYLDLSNQIKELFTDDNSKFIAATSFYSGAWDKAKFKWNFAKSYDFNTQTIPVILLCNSDTDDLLAYAFMDYSIKDDKFMNLKLFNTYYGQYYILGTGIESDSNAMQGNLSESERTEINRGADINNILDYVHQFDLDHPNGVDNPDLDAAVKIKLEYNGLE